VHEVALLRELLAASSQTSPPTTSGRDRHRRPHCVPCRADGVTNTLPLDKSLDLAVGASRQPVFEIEHDRSRHPRILGTFTLRQYGFLVVERRRWRVGLLRSLSDGSDSGLPRATRCGCRSGHVLASGPSRGLTERHERPSAATQSFTRRRHHPSTRCRSSGCSTMTSYRVRSRAERSRRDGRHTLPETALEHVASPAGREARVGASQARSTRGAFSTATSLLPTTFRLRQALSIGTVSHRVAG